MSEPILVHTGTTENQDQKEHIQNSGFCGTRTEAGTLQTTELEGK